MICAWRSRPLPSGAPRRVHPGRSSRPATARTWRASCDCSTCACAMLKKLGNDEQALIGGPSGPHQRPADSWRSATEVLVTWDQYVEPMIQLVSADGAFEQGVRRVEQVLLRLLGEQQRLGHPWFDDDQAATHARILEMTNAQADLRAPAELCCRCEGSAPAQRETRGAALAGGDPAQGAWMSCCRRRCRCSPGRRAPSRHRPAVESYVFAPLARFEPEAGAVPQVQRARAKSNGRRDQRTARGNDRALPGRCRCRTHHAMAAGPGTGRRHRRGAIVGSPGCRDALPARTPATPRVRNHRILRQPLLLRPEPAAKDKGQSGT